MAARALWVLHPSHRFSPHFPHVVAFQKKCSPRGLAFGAGTVFDEDEKLARFGVDFQNPEHRFAADSEEAMQWNVWVRGVPQKTSGGEIRNVSKGGEDLADDSPAVFSHQHAGRAAGAEGFDPSSAGVLVIFFHFHNQLAGVERQHGVQFVALDFSAFEAGKQLAGSG